MSEFVFNCPQCGQELSVEESCAGQVLECPNCHRGIVVPRSQSRQDIPSSMPKRTQSPQFRDSRHLASSSLSIDSRKVMEQCKAQMFQQLGSYDATDYNFAPVRKILKGLYVLGNIIIGLGMAISCYCASSLGLGTLICIIVPGAVGFLFLYLAQAFAIAIFELTKNVREVRDEMVKNRYLLKSSLEMKP